MAFATKIELVPFANREGGIFDGTAWWDAYELCKDPRFRALQLNDGYLDYIAILTPAEAQELDARFSPRALDHQKEDAERLSERLREVRWVIVQVYEWESGF